MGKIFIIAIGLYLLFLACYLLWEWLVKRRRNATKNATFNPFRSAPKEDIIGKSGFDLRHSLPEATTLIKSEKREENTPIFAGGNAKEDTPNTPAVVPPDRLDQVFSSTSSEDDSDEIDLVIDDKPEDESESDEDDDNKDYDESEDAEEAAGGSVATGVKFNELAGMLKTVDNHETATQEEKEEAGRVITEIRQTDMFEQVVSGEPKKKTVLSALMDEHFAAFHRRKREAGEETNEPTVKAPDNFDVRAFA